MSANLYQDPHYWATGETPDEVAQYLSTLAQRVLHAEQQPQRSTAVAQAGSLALATTMYEPNRADI